MHTRRAWRFRACTPDMERMTGFEPVASTLARSRATSCATSAFVLERPPTSSASSSGKLFKSGPSSSARPTALGRRPVARLVCPGGQAEAVVRN